MSDMCTAQDARALQIAHVMVNESANMDGVAAEARGSA